MHDFLTRLRLPGVIVGDGAMGTMLQDRGVRPGDCPERVNIESPAILEEIASAYLAAGAEIIQTNTFGGSPLKLSAYGLDRRTEEINARAIQAVRNAVGDRSYVSFSCGPSGKLLEPYGDTAAEEVYESFRRQLQVAVAEGVDAIVVETMTDLNEALLAIKAARSVSPAIPVLATMTFDATPRGFFTIMGTSIPQAVAGLTEAGANAIGSNCGNGIANMIRIAQEFSTLSSLPMVIQSNAGLPVVKEGKTFYPESPDFMAEKSRELTAAGVRIVGGCCGTTPGHIAAIQRSLL